METARVSRGAVGGSRAVTEGTGGLPEVVDLKRLTSSKSKKKLNDHLVKMMNLPQISSMTSK